MCFCGSVLSSGLKLWSFCLYLSRMVHWYGNCFDVNHPSSHKHLHIVAQGIKHTTTLFQRLQHHQKEKEIKARFSTTMAMNQVELGARMEIGRAAIRLPFSLSAHYALAVRVAPQIVMTESDPLRFLFSEKNIHGAALKLAGYWCIRSNRFGERAFLPMNLSGTGALTHQDIAALRESYIQRLPNDVLGQAVYLIKAASLMGASSMTPSGIRALFYQLHLSSKEQSAGRIQLLVDASDHTAASSLADLRALFGVLSELVDKALPVKVIRVVILASPLTTLTRSMHAECVKQLVVQSSLSTQVVVVKVTSPQDLTDKLGSFGLTAAAGLMPSVLLGGSAAFGPMMSPPGAAMMISNAMNPPLRYEPAYHVVNAAHGGNSAFAPAPPSAQQLASGNGFRQEEGKASQMTLASKRMASSSTQEEQGSNKKIKAYSRSSNHNNDSSQPSPFPQDNRSAAILLQHPCAQVAVGTTSHYKKEKEEEEEETKVNEALRNKQRNAVYSRRKYQRQKIWIEVTKSEARRHRVQNAKLRQEQKRLEQLLAQAIQCIKEHEGDNLLLLDGDDDLKKKEGGVVTYTQHAAILATAATASSPPSPAPALTSDFGALCNQEMMNFHDRLGTVESSTASSKGMVNSKSTSIVGGVTPPPIFSNGD
jgi:hypothetical protein